MADKLAYGGDPPGVVQAFDVRTGARVWAWDPVPGPGEPGNETWEDGSWRDMGHTNVWAPFTADTSYWPAEKQGMVNFTVDDLDGMLAQLRDAGVEVDEKVEAMEGIGRFGWAVDPEGNRFELWQPPA